MRALCLIALIAAATSAVCPSNGNNHGVFVTFNGASGFEDILVLDTFGGTVGALINRTTVPAHVGKFRKLRCIRESPYDGRLFLCSGAPKFSKILVLSAGPTHVDCTRDVEGVFTRHSPANAHMLHPYDIAFVPLPGHIAGRVRELNHAIAGHDYPMPGRTPAQQHHDDVRAAELLTERHALLQSAAHGGFEPRAFVTNQNTGVITWYRASTSASGAAGEELPPPSELVRVNPDAAKSVFIQPDVGPGAVAGIKSVRGVKVSPDGTLLVVCDEDSHAVHVFDANTSAFKYSLKVPAPIQVDFAPDSFFAERLTEEEERARRMRSEYSTGVQERLDAADRERELSPAAREHTRLYGHQLMLITTKTADVYWTALAPTAQPQPFTRGPGQTLTGRRSTGLEDSLGTAESAGKNGVEGRLSGLSINYNMGVVYVADRVGRSLHRIRFDGLPIGDKDGGVRWGGMDFGPRFQDQPEFLLYSSTVGPPPVAMPSPCYELGPDGPKRSMLCVGGEVLLGLAVAAAAVLLFDAVRGRVVIPYLARRLLRREGSDLGL